ncbi:hypothetical protein FRC01_007681 [Tulasnella sp. 417]|nr:hypothetical protein FRC01_007681 [Tulasnella sp. 417]
MDALSIHPGTSEKAIAKKLRREVKETIPKSVHDLMTQQMIVVQYGKGVSKKKEQDVVVDLARVLPGIEPLLYVWKLSTLSNQRQRFTVFLSDFDEIPLAQVLRSHYKTLAKALLAKSGSMRHLTNFVCRVVDLMEKMPVADLVTGYTLPFEGASIVLERDRELINEYEAEYEEAASRSRDEQAKLAPPVSIKEAITTDRTAAKDSTEQGEGPAEGSGAPFEKDEVSQADRQAEESTSSTGQKRKRGKGAEGDQAGASDSDSSSASAPSSSQRSKKRKRGNKPGLDPITTKDRDEWILHVALESQDVHGSSDLLKEFLTMRTLQIGANRRWTVQQWEIYLKDNKSYITQQVGKLRRELL